MGGCYEGITGVLRGVTKCYGELLGCYGGVTGELQDGYSNTAKRESPRNLNGSVIEPCEDLLQYENSHYENY